MSTPLCIECSKFVNEVEETKSQNEHPTVLIASDIHALREKAQNGCQLCRNIYQCSFYRTSISWDLRYQTKAIHLRICWADQGRGDTYLRICYGEDGVWNEVPLAMRDDRCEAPDASWSQVERPILDICSNEGLQDAAELARTWILECHNSHMNCRRASRSQNRTKVLPTRVIDVGSLDGQGIPKLLVPQQPVQDMEYAVLSYAWGSDPTFAKTTASNIHQMTTSLPWNSLAKTVQDAIIFTRKLGIRYLWVDALCILQSEGPNDEQHKTDWSYEAGRFGDYYENSVLTIAATGATSASQGLFLPRPALEFNSQPLIFSQTYRRLVTQRPIPFWESEIRNSPLLSRGWAIQERLLSKRILHFGSNCLSWECQGCQAIEAIPHLTIPSKYDYMGRSFPTEFNDLENCNERSIIDAWYDFLELYSLTDFTFARDRLPALSGIASRLQTRLSQKYIAGIWESSIAKGLTWFTHGTSRPNGEGQNSNLNLPSWCWASTGGPVTFSFQHGYVYWDTMVEVESWSAETDGADVSGQILRASMRISGGLKMINLSEVQLFALRDFDSVAPWREEMSESYNEAVERGLYQHVFIDAEKHVTSIRSEPQPCLLVGTVETHAKDLRGGSIVEVATALILRSTGNRVGDVEEYTRIGLVRLPFADYWSHDQETTTVELV